jgi:hypothetical protein
VVLAVAGLGWAKTSSADTGLSCGDTVTADVTLTADLNCRSGVGLTVVGAVTLDFAGHSLSGSGHGAEAIRSDAATLLNGTIRGFMRGIDGPVTVENMFISRNGIGIAGASQSVTVINSSIVANTDSGIAGAGFTLIRDSKILRNGGYGVATIQGLNMSGSTVADNGGHGVNANPNALFLLNNAVTLVGNIFRNDDIYVFTPYQDPVYVANNLFINSLLTVDPAGGQGGVIIDGGGNRGNSCIPEISCGR